MRLGTSMAIQCIATSGTRLQTNKLTRGVCVQVTWFDIPLYVHVHQESIAERIVLRVLYTYM